MKNEINNTSDFILYMSNDGEVKVDVMVQDESVWLTQLAMQDLFGRAKSTVSVHIKNVFSEGELDESVVVRKFRTTSKHGDIFGNAAAEIIYKRADSARPLMGLKDF